MDIKKYNTIETIEAMLDDNDLIIAGLQANIDLKTQRIEHTEERLKRIELANKRLFGYTRIMRFKDSQHLSEMKKLTYRHYQDGLKQRLTELK